MSEANCSHESNGCGAIRDRIEAFVLEDLPAGETRRIERHLARCSSCRREVREKRDLFALLAQALEPSQPSPDVLLGLLQRIQVSQRRRRSWTLGLGMAVSAALTAVAVLVIQPTLAAPLARVLESPDIAVINLFAAIDSPLTSRYEYRTESRIELDSSVGRIYFNVVSGEWRLVVHGLPRPPRGARYVLSAQLDREEAELGTIERWEDGVAVLTGKTPHVDLTRTDRLSVTLVSAASRLRLLDSVEGAW